MNRKGGIMLTVFFAIIIFLVGVVFVNFLIPDVTTFRAGMDCASASTISDGAKLTCLFGDSVVPLFIITIISLAGGSILDRLVA